LFRCVLPDTDGVCERLGMQRVLSSFKTLAGNPGCNPVCRVCHYKALDYPTQLARKRAWAEQQLGSWSSVLGEIIPAPDAEQIGYRSKSWMKASFTEGEISFGMERAVWRDGEWQKDFISWDTCPLHLESIQEMIARIKNAFAAAGLDQLRDSLVGLWLGSPQLVIVARAPALEEVIRKIDWKKILVAPFDRVWFHSNSQVGKKIFGHLEIVPIYGAIGAASASGEGSIHPIRAFRQVAQSLLVQARHLAVQALLQAQPALVVDLYCGTGDLSLLLPPATGWLGVELSSEAIKYACSLRNTELAPHAAFVGTVEHRLQDPRVLAMIAEPYSLYINPPRSGLSEEARARVVELLRAKPPLSLVYLSCSASSLARDLRGFENEGYQVELLQPYDFFPQTEHFETLAVLRR
jgi:23S rRNA (uracil1939-C5)-methyltransferase